MSTGSPITTTSPTRVNRLARLEGGGVAGATCFRRDRILVLARDAGASTYQAPRSRPVSPLRGQKQDVRRSCRRRAWRYEPGPARAGVRDLHLTAELGGREVFRSHSRLQVD